jgi:hypothetical protein
MKSDKPDSLPAVTAVTSRRKFTKTVASILVAAPLAISWADGQEPSVPKKSASTGEARPSPSTLPSPSPSPMPSPSPADVKPSPVAEAYAEVARARFGDKLTPDEIEKIKKDLDGYARAAERLRSVKLQNGDEPDFIFAV